MARPDRSDLSPCRCELLQMAFEDLAWPTISIEHLLDRLSEPPDPGSGAPRKPRGNQGA